MVHALTLPAGTEHGKIRAAGVVLWRPGGRDGELELALIHRPKLCDWSFPKGKLKEGERSKEAALREALEETGMRVQLGARLPTQHYRVKGRPKRVRYWSAVRISGRFTPNREADRLEWLSADRARRRLSYGHDRELVDALLTRLGE
ncbi:NUDIX hydrolase [Streptacidiphilus sp. PB12-B1b]|uniref:NUDIX hydrolase n=1 Tax=Streptacidiphilus sp. PB12-B1b TaxID=2705012 RepID=UPI0015F8D5AE|nr:NUDIX hydrolase [Streptacidiphilus sp. PB12-B1b]QMU79638.1 NUDIX hydrolase [Streptacidiphilus sp. PB12-B1b]